jgi:hypothetical protein
MGGCGFENVGKGRSASEVFNKLVEEARYESGHGGYSGTIAEKGDFTIIPQPSQDTLRATLAQQIEHAKRSVAYSEKECANSSTPNTYLQQALEQSQKTLRELESMNAQATIVATRDLLRHYTAWYEDKHQNEKWGPAYCLVVKEPQTILGQGSVTAAKLAIEKFGPDAEVTIKTERASKANGNKKTVRAFITNISKNPGWGCNEKVLGGYKHTVKTASGPDANSARGALFAEDGEYIFFGVASS